MQRYGKNKSNGCYEFQCHNESGPIYWKHCNKTDEVCENDQCVIKEEVTYYVEIEVNGIDVSDLNMTEIQQTISNLTNIKADKVRIQVETNDKNEVITIIVIVDDEESANQLMKKIDEHDQEGFLRNCKSVRVVMKENKLSVSSGIMKKEGFINMITIVFMAFIIRNHLQ